MAEQAIELDKDAFMRLAIEKKLDVKGPTCGYLYAGFETEKGYELYRCIAGGESRHIYWTYRQVCTQDNAGGGTLAFSCIPQAGTGITKFYGSLTASGNRAAFTGIYNATPALLGYISVVGAVAGASATFARAA